jgi:uncharacterized protein (TIGR03067 family)
MNQSYGAILLLSFVVVACETPRPVDPFEDLKAWQGTWKMVSATYDGEPQTGDLLWIVQGDQYRTYYQQHLDEVSIKITLDASHKHVDAFHHDTPKGTHGGKLKGIYKVSGDSLTVCYDLTDSQYPTSFEATRGSRRVLYQFRRQ